MGGFSTTHRLALTVKMAPLNLQADSASGTLSKSVQGWAVHSATRGSSWIRKSGRPLHVLMIPSFYPQPDQPGLGIFFRDQALALNNQGLRAGIVYPETRALRMLCPSRIAESHFQRTCTTEGNIPTCRQKGWNPWLNTIAGGRAWSIACQALVRRYIYCFGRPDLLHAQCCFWAGHAAMKACRTWRLPFVLTEHSSEFLEWCPEEEGPRPRLARQILSQTHGLAGVSRAILDAIAPFSPRTGQVIPNVVDVDFFTLPPQGSQRLPLRFLSVGRLDANKGFDTAVRAFAKAFAHVSAARLRLVGDGPRLHELIGLVQELKIEGQVDFLGSLPRESVRKEMWEATSLVMPSFRETFGVVAIEAMSTGLPVIASRCGGPEDILDDDPVALFAPGDVEALAERMHRFSFPQTTPHEALRARCVERYSPPALAARLQEFYWAALDAADIPGQEPRPPFPGSPWL